MAVFDRLLKRLRPELRLIGLTLVTLAIGATFYHFVEGWRWLDSIYFAVITLTTVGYGDISPQTDAGKIFTIFYIFAGLGIIAAFIQIIAQRRVKALAIDDDTPPK